MTNQNSDKGSISITLLTFVFLLSGSFFGNVFLKKLLMETSSHKNLCRKESLKVSHLRGQKSEKLILLNKRITKLKKRERFLLGNLSLNPSPAHKIRLMAQLKRVRLRLMKIHGQQKQVFLSFSARASLHLNRLQKKVSKLCKKNSSICSPVLVPKKLELPVQKISSSIPALYSWDLQKLDLAPLAWTFKSESLKFENLLFLKNQLKVEVKCKSTINIGRHHYKYSALTQDRE